MKSPLYRTLRATLPWIASALGLSPISARAGGFALVEQNALAAGTSWSDAAAAEDASTVFFNPAGLVWLPQSEMVTAGHLIATRVSYRDAGSTTAGVLPLSGGNGGNGGGAAPIPNFYLSRPLGRSLAAGVGLCVPWGLSTNYASGWDGRYQALKSELKTDNLTAALAWRAGERVSLGAGAQWQRASVDLGNAIDFGLAGYQLGLPGWLPGLHDGTVRIHGSDSALGAVAGVLYEPQPGTRVGLSWRSKLNYAFNGQATFSDVPAPFAAAFPDQAARSRLATPTTISLHALQEWDKWRFTANATWWQFSCFKTLAIDFANAATPDSLQPQNWKNAAIYSFGVAYRWSNDLTLRAGVAANPSPVPGAALRSPRIPDSNRRWISVGASWRPNARFQLDAGYVHLFFADAPIDTTDAFTHRLRGDFQVSADIVSLQGTMRF